MLEMPFAWNEQSTVGVIIGVAPGKSTKNIRFLSSERGEIKFQELTTSQLSSACVSQTL
jgi:hypothetical protein